MTENNRFIIIGRSTCPFCNQAVDYCNAKSAQSIFLDYVNQEHTLEEYKEFYNQKTVPIILANNLETGYTKKIGGYTDLLDFL
jgi:glutaredoxin